MILELAKQSVQTKIKLKSATMLGNYEFYYAAGILNRELQLGAEATLTPRELYDYLRSRTDGKEYENSTVTHLIKMIYFYMPEDTYDEQMQELFVWGSEGK